MGLLWLQNTRSELHRPFKTWSSAVQARIGMCVALLAAPFFPRGSSTDESTIWYVMYAIVACSVVLFGLVYSLV